MHGNAEHKASWPASLSIIREGFSPDKHHLLNKARIFALAKYVFHVSFFKTTPISSGFYGHEIDSDLRKVILWDLFM